MKKIIAILLGAVVLFVWGFVSWGLLHWHQADWKSLPNEAKVVEALKQGAPEPGMYSIPGQAGKAAADWEKAAMEGPWALGVVRIGKFEGGMAPLMIKQFLANVVIAFLLGFLLSHAAALPMARRLLFGAVVGLVVGLVGHAPPHIWFETPLIVTLKLIADNVIGCVLASGVIGLFMCHT